MLEVTIHRDAQSDTAKGDTQFAKGISKMKYSRSQDKLITVFKDYYPGSIKFNDSHFTSALYASTVTSVLVGHCNLSAILEKKILT